MRGRRGAGRAVAGLQLRHLAQDFDLETLDGVYRLGGFKGFFGQAGHVGHERFALARKTVSLGWRRPARR